MLKFMRHYRKELAMTLGDKSLAKDIVFEENNFNVVFMMEEHYVYPSIFPRLMKAQ